MPPLFLLSFFLGGIMQIIKSFMRDQSGATAIEYSLIAAGIAAVIMTSVQILGDQTNSIFEMIRIKMKKVG